MKIGEFSRLAQLSIRMLRHYDDIGLLSPQRVDPLTGYREYAAHQLRQLRRIQTLRDLGFSLDETRDFLQEQIPAETFAALLRAKRDDLRRHLSEMEARLGRLDARLLALEEEHPMPDFDTLRTFVPALLVVSVSDEALQLPLSGGGLDISALYDRLYQVTPMEDRSLPQINLWTDSADGPAHAEVTHVLSRPITETSGVRVYMLPSVPDAAMLTYRGHYADEGMMDAFAALHGWVESSGYQEAGPTRQVFLGPAEPGATDRFEIQLQVPVRRA